MTAATPTLLITGASGHMGRVVLDTLLELKAGPLIATTRTPASLSSYAAKGVDVRAADFDRPETLAAAFRGATRALLISTDALDRPGRRVEQHRNAIRAFEAAGVSTVVYTSLPNPGPGSPVTIAPDHHHTEMALQESKLEYTVLRNNLYADLLLQSLPGAVASGLLVDARGTGATAYVTRFDCARTAAHALHRGTPGRHVFDVTGPEAVTSAQLASLVGELVGKPITHRSVPADALIAGMVSHGLPPPVAQLLASFDAAIAKGDLKNVSNTVATLTGRPPQSVATFLAANKAALLGTK